MARRDKCYAAPHDISLNDLHRVSTMRSKSVNCETVSHYLFFFSSRRRHTRFKCDWSSDVCSSDLVSLLVTLKGLPLAYNKDLQETQEPVFLAAETAVQSLKTAIGFMRQVEFDYERMQRAAQAGFMNALAAATYLVNKGVSFRKAHEHIGNAVCYCLEKGCELRDLSLPELRQFSPEFAEDFYSCLGLDAVLACHNVTGGTHPARVREALAKVRQQIALLSGEVHAHA